MPYARCQRVSAEKDIFVTVDGRIARCHERWLAHQPEIASKVIKLFRTFNPPAQAAFHLTPRETRWLKLLLEKHRYKTAADELKRQAPTVAVHMKSIYRKLHVHSKSEAVVTALRHKLF